MKKLIYPAALILLFIILTTTILPADAVYGSNTDWLSQHAALAETIRDACVEQHTLFPTGSISEAEAADISFLIMDF